MSNLVKILREHAQLQKRALGDYDVDLVQALTSAAEALEIAHRLRSAHRAIVDSIFAHQEANTQATVEEKSRLQGEMDTAEKAFKEYFK